MYDKITNVPDDETFLAYFYALIEEAFPPKNKAKSAQTWRRLYIILNDLITYPQGMETERMDDDEQEELNVEVSLKILFFILKQY